MKTSRISGFYKLSLVERLAAVQRFADLSPDEIETLRSPDGLPLEMAARMIENVGGLYHLPVGFAANFRIDGRDRLVPMVTEEPSIVAAASNMARILRDGPGIETGATDPIMIAQIQVCDVPDMAAARAAVLAEADTLIAKASALDPRLVAAGGGARRIEVRELPETFVGPMLVVHIHADVRDAMGANAVNTMAEALAPDIARLTGGEVGLRILSNLADQRLVRAVGRVPVGALASERLGLTGEQVADRIVRASAFAEADPYRAVTHNKGLMNGVDAVLMGAGQDLRAVEAGAHAFAARDGRYTALSTWRREGAELVGRAELPMQVGIVGGVTKVHPVVKVLLKVLGVATADELSRIAVSVGLAQNLGAILALSTEGIQRGHMSLHARNIAAAAGARDDQIDAVVSGMVAARTFTHEAAERLLEEMSR